MLKIFIDTNCELWHTDVDSNIDIIKMPYIVEGVEYFYDLGKNTDFKEFYKKLKNGVIPTTAGLNQYQYIQYFEKYFKEGYDILYISFSDKLSATFKYLNAAVDELKQKYPNTRFERFDTRSISMGAGIQIYYALEMYKKGSDIDSIISFLEQYSKHIRVLFAVDSLLHLKRGGRISTTKATLGSMLSLKPIITITDDGLLKPLCNIRGRKNIIQFFVDDILKNQKDLDKYDIWIMHADYIEMADKLENEIHNQVSKDIKIHKVLVGPVIATHCGPNTVGLIYTAKTR